MRPLCPLLGAALALAAPAAAAAQGSPGGFRLPPAPAPTGPSRVQGPVVSDVPESRRVRQETPSPSPTPADSPAPTPAASAPLAPPIAVPSTAPVSAPAQQTAAPAPRPTARPVAPGAASPAAASAAPSRAAGGAGEAAPGLGPLPPTVPDPVPAAAAPAPAAGTGWLSWLAGGAAGLALVLGLGWLLWRRRAARAAEPPEIEKPRAVAPPPPPQPAPAPVPAPAPAAAEPTGPLSLTLEPLRLSLTLVNASLAYRLEVVNRGSEPLSGLVIEADMISAHASLSREEQLAGPTAGGGAGAPERHTLDPLDPGESRVIQGEFRLPFGQIVPIRQGSATLLLPLARFRAAIPGGPAVVRTFAVGQAGATPSAGLQPFRLDQGPRVYPRLTQRAFA